MIIIGRNYKLHETKGHKVKDLQNRKYLKDPFGFGNDFGLITT